MMDIHINFLDNKYAVQNVHVSSAWTRIKNAGNPIARIEIKIIIDEMQGNRRDMVIGSIYSTREAGKEGLMS